MTPMEQKLAKRLHRQRARIAQLEGYKGRAYDRWERWRDLALRLQTENRALKAYIDEMEVAHHEMETDI